MATKLILGALAVIPSALALTGVLIAPEAQAFEVERRGTHGAYRIVTPQQSEAPQVEKSTAKTQAQQQQSTRRSPIFVRSLHGSYRILNQDGVGGPVNNSEIKGTPDLDGTIHHQDGWF